MSALQTLKQLIEHEQQKLGQQLSQWLIKQQQQQATLQHLTDYRQHYETEYAAKYEVLGAPVNVIKDHRLFLQRLNEGIEQQTEVLLAIEKDVQHLRQQLQAEYQRETSIDQLQIKRQQQLQQQQNKQEQKQMDELANVKPQLTIGKT